MSTDPALVLAQWLSPAFPVGAFAYSHGLEAAIDAGWIADAQGLQDWLRDLVQHGSAQADAVLVRAGYRGTEGADAHARAFAASAERLAETDLQGAAFCDTLAATEGMQLPRLTYPVAVGQAARAKGLPEDLTVAMYLQAFVSNLVSAAMRAVPLGQTDGQKVLIALRPLIDEAVAHTAHAGLEDLTSACWMSDIAAMRHETMHTRIFRT